MPRIGDTYQSNSAFLKVEDLKKRKVNVTITGAPVEKVGDDDKIVLYFDGTEKKFPLNITNARLMEMLTGSDDSDAWVGTTITLKPDMTTYQGKPTPCIRIDSELPPQQQQAPRPSSPPQGFGQRQDAASNDIPF